jgi:hypothetical protein
MGHFELAYGKSVVNCDLVYRAFRAPFLALIRAHLKVAGRDNDHDRTSRAICKLGSWRVIHRVATRRAQDQCRDRCHWKSGLQELEIHEIHLFNPRPMAVIRLLWP